MGHEAVNSKHQRRGKKRWIALVIALPFVIAFGFWADGILYRGQCGALTVAVPSNMRQVVLNLHERYERGEQVDHILQVILDDFPDFHRMIRFHRCVDFRPSDAKWGRYSWQDFLDGRITKQQLLDEAMSVAGPKPRWDRFGPIAFLIAGEQPGRLYPVIVGRIDETRGGWSSLYYIRNDGGVRGNCRDINQVFEELDPLGLPRPPEDIWKPVFEQR